MEKALIERRFSKAIKSYRNQAGAQMQIARTLIRHIKRNRENPAFSRVLEVGCGSGALTREFLRSYTPEHLYLNDLCSEIASGEITEYMAPAPSTEVNYLIGDVERLALPQDLDIIISSSVLQWLESPLSFIIKSSKLLRKGGIMAFSLFGPQNLYEIATLTKVSLNYLPLEAFCGRLSADFELLEAKEEKITLLFDSPREVLLHLKGTGVNGVGDYRWSKKSLHDFISAYWERYALPSGKVHLTYHPYYIILKKRN